MRRYRSESNQRWEGFEHRHGDIVISTRSKCGTTWLQMICALLVFQEPELPAPLAELSPWLDWEVEPLDVVRARLDAQQHRRIIKTHTPLAGLPLQAGVTYVVVGRHPLAVATSLYHHGRNIDRERFADLTGRRTRGPDGPLDPWAARWVDPGVGPELELDSLPGLVHHVADAWDRNDGTDVALLHYRDLADDTEGQMRALAAHLGIEVEPDRWATLVAAAGFGAMRRDAARLAPDRLGVLRSPAAFFRTGPGGGVGTGLSAGTRRRYDDRIAELAPPDLRAWLER